MDTYNLIKYKIWKLLKLYNDMNQIFIQYNIKKLKTIIYSCDDSLENNVDFVLSSCAFKSLTEFYNENNLKYENNMQFKYYDILVKAHYLSYSIIKYINNLFIYKIDDPLVIISKMTFFDLPGSEVLNENPDSLRVK